MLTLHQAKNPKTRKPGRVGLAVAGGGPLGAIYELGALHALQDSTEGLALHRLDVYVGISAGAVLAAGLANRVSTAELCRVFTNRKDAETGFQPQRFMRPAYREYMKRAAKLPDSLRAVLRRLMRDPFGTTASELISDFSRMVPVGLFDNEAVQEYLADFYAQPGRTDDFRELKADLFVVAADLDSGAAIRFGEGDLADVPISQAVQASAALPGLYPPVEIKGRYFLDGALRRTMHASAALDQDVDLLLAVNPLVPFDTTPEQPDHPDIDASNLVNGGLPMVLSQTFRALIQSRMKVGFEKYQRSYPHSDLLLLEPDRDDQDIFFTNIFSYASRNRLIAHAFAETRSELLARSDDLADQFQRHGIKLRMDRLEDKHRTVSQTLDESPPPRSVVGRRLDDALDHLDSVLSKQ